MININLKSNNDCIKSIIVGDIHLKGKNPENRKDFYKDSILKKVKEILDVAKKENIDMIFLLGDVFDTHTVSNNTFSALYKILEKSKTPIYSIVGNHDELAENFRSYKDGSLGLLEELGVVKILQDNELYYFIKNDIKLQVTANNYRTLMEEDKNKFIVQKENNCTHAIHLTHAYLVEKPVPFSHLLISSISNKTEADITYIGHYHDPFEVKQNDKWFVDTGAISRNKASLSDFRQPFVTIQTITKDNIIREKYELKSAKLPEEVLDRTKLEENKLKEEKRQEFMAKTLNIKNKIKEKKINANEVLATLVEELNVPNEVYLDALKELEEANLIKNERKGNKNEEN